MTDRSRPDFWARRAKREGLVARSAYKLEEIDRRWRLLRRGDRVLDLGAAPGSWLQYAGGRVGPTGRVVGWDLRPIRQQLPDHVSVHVGDALQAPFGDQRFDIVLSDMAPATMGERKTDALRSAMLAEGALNVAEGCLRLGGHVVVKVLEGGEVVALAARMSKHYTRMMRLRPKATRKDSTEIFLIGLDKRAAAQAHSKDRFDEPRHPPPLE